MPSLYPYTLTNLPLVGQGKTRDTYRVPRKRGQRPLLLIYASDRISTHNVVHESRVPFKGEVLAALTVFWLTGPLAHLPNHLVGYGRKVSHYLGTSGEYPSDVPVRSILVEEVHITLVELIFRAYLTGSLYSEHYKDKQANARGIVPNPYGIAIPAGWPVMAPFEPPIFTPTEKSKLDLPLRADEVERMYPDATRLQREAFTIMRRYLNVRGIELVDGKGECGVNADGRSVIADEIGTPDCCRFAELAAVKPGVVPPWLDKQVARDEAERTWNGGKKVPLTFSPATVKALTNTYLNVFERIVGMPLAQFQRERLS